MPPGKEKRGVSRNNKSQPAPADTSYQLQIQAKNPVQTNPANKIFQSKIQNRKASCYSSNQ